MEYKQEAKTWNIGPLLDTFGDVNYNRDELQLILEEVDETHTDVMVGLAAITTKSEELNKMQTDVYRTLRSMKAMMVFGLVLFLTLILTNQLVWHNII